MLLIPRNTPIKSKKKMKPGEIEYVQSLEAEFREHDPEQPSESEMRQGEAKLKASLRRVFANRVGFPHSKLYQRRAIWWNKELLADREQITRENSDICKKIETGELSYLNVWSKR